MPSTTFASRMAQPWVLALLFALFLGYFGAFQWRNGVLLQTAAALGTSAGDVEKQSRPFDGRFGYGPEDVNEFRSAVDEDGLRFYRRSQCFMDGPFPLVYGLLLLGLLHAGLAGTKAHRFVWIGLLAGICGDVAENALSLILARSNAPPSSGVIQIASICTQLKWIALLGGGVVVCVATVVRHHRAIIRAVPMVITALIVTRVSVIAALVLLSLPFLGSSTPTIGNMLSVHTGLHTLEVGVLAVVAAGTVGITMLQTWRHAGERMRVALPPLPQTLAPARANSALPFCLLAAPLLCTVATASSSAPDGDQAPFEALLWLATGSLVALALSGVVEWMRRKAAERIAPRLFGDSRCGRVLGLLGDGYVMRPTNMPYPGHIVSLVCVVLLCVLYAALYFVLRDQPERMPTLAYALLILLIAELMLAGLAFFFDRFRIPLTVIVAAYSLLLFWRFDRDHAFLVLPKGTLEPAEIHTAVDARQELQEARAETPTEAEVLTVVCASGGGIQAAAWTAQVLAGLNDSAGPAFTRSIHLVSATSGGSVGAYHALSGISPESGALVANSNTPTPPAVVAATGSSLEATAWGLAFPDLMRGFVPIEVHRLRDRASAMERAWRRHNAAVLDASGAGPEPTLGMWADRVRAGTLPGLILNATFIEDAQQFLGTTLDLAALGRTNDGSPRSGPPVEDPDQKEHFKCRAPLNMPVSTAARLSATFPWVSPTSRAGDRDGEPLQGAATARFHIGDGGYFDNYGTFMASRWLEHVLGNDDSRKRFKTVLILEIRAFPPALPNRTNAAPAWKAAALGPFLAIIGVRNSTQVVRSEVGWQRVGRAAPKDIEIYRIVVQPPKRGEHELDPPLSWHLAEHEKRRVTEDWKQVAPKITGAVEDLLQGRKPDEDVASRL